MYSLKKKEEINIEDFMINLLINIYFTFENKIIYPNLLCN